MPGPISDSHPGSSDNCPYVPAHCYMNGPLMCPCGHHEGYHNGNSQCLRVAECKCSGLPEDCFTTDEEFIKRATQ